jgi:hypothetical protein
MKKYIILGIISILLLGCLACSDPQNSVLDNTSYSILGDGNSIYQLNTSLPKESTDIAVYKVIQPLVTEEFVKELGTKVGFSSTPVLHTRERDGFSFYLIDNKDNGTSLQVFTQTGAMSISCKRP